MKPSFSPNPHRSYSSTFSDLVKESGKKGISNTDADTLLEDNEIQQLRVPGLHIHRDFSIPIALELEGKIYAVINDCQGNIRNLIDPNSRTLIHHYKWTAFGESLSEADLAPFFSPVLTRGSG